MQATHKVLDIATGKTEFTGTLKECRSWKRKNYNYFSRIHTI
jgi:hypothetical protein